MSFKLASVSLFMGVVIVAGANAQDADLVAGEKLYIAQCQICHGSAAVSHTGDRAPISPERRFMQLAMQQPSVTDVSAPMTFSQRAEPRLAADAAGGQLAFAPPFGPNLQGVYGRAAGTAKGYEYSGTFLKALTGMEWNDAALDVWITNPQTWVPGVYMFYKQPDPEIRRKIIAYLKANR